MCTCNAVFYFSENPANLYCRCKLSKLVVLSIQLRQNCIHIFMIYQLHALIANYMHTVHLMAFSLCLLTLELNYKGKQTWQGSGWFLESSEATDSRFLWFLWQKWVLVLMALWHIFGCLSRNTFFIFQNSWLGIH